MTLSSDGLRLSMEGKLWGFCLTTAILLCGIGCQYNPSEHRCIVLIVNDDTYSGVIRNGKDSPSQINFSGNCTLQKEIQRLCIISTGENTTTSEKCNPGFPNCTFEVRKDDNSYFITLSNVTVNNQELNFWFPLRKNITCIPSQFYQNTTGDQTTPVKPETFCGKDSTYDADACRNKTPDKFILKTTAAGPISCLTCDNPVKKPDINICVPSGQMESSSGVISADLASEAMKNLSSLIELMGNASTAAISMGKVKGFLSRLHKEDPKDINFGFSPDKDMSIVEDKHAMEKYFNRSVRLSKEAYEMALNKSGTFVGVLVFPSMSQDEKKSIVLNGEVFGIEIGAHIANLTDTIDIEYRNVDKVGFNVFCNSWNGKGKLPNWTTDGCQTLESNNSITCQCTHLSFFAILMSPPPKNISASDVASLTYISYVGCGLSMFFLGLALFMQFVISKTKSSQATKILVNLFLAMLFLNLTFLTNETIAAMGSYVACVIIAAVMHYSMLSTFTWFFIEAVHLFLQLKKLNANIKHYMLKVYVVGWVLPALVVIILLGLQKYTFMSIKTDDGKSVNMCWITDIYIHYGVNIGYYAWVFVWTLTIFIIVVRQILFLRKTNAGKGQNDPASKNTLTILGLLFLLGLTWGFAFFSYGPMIIPSYYIFSILNSFQGFFLFLYYYNTNKIVGDDRNSVITNKGSSTCSTNYDDTPVHKK
ncbi:adhesion G protein-coupled receptor G3 isoform X1 [Salmo trutta]|uniref:Adhesion G-protein coupled receptor G5-like n=1 Tax=Salmo trutta TaxID=8032 RepID=A0A674EHC7_SALTR|nr:adhesion G protein-coupled receptor G3-like isoform X1 [Salmo trutta]